MLAFLCNLNLSINTVLTHINFNSMLHDTFKFVPIFKNYPVKYCTFLSKEYHLFNEVYFELAKSEMAYFVASSKCIHIFKTCSKVCLYNS